MPTKPPTTIDFQAPKIIGQSLFEKREIPDNILAYLPFHAAEVHETSMLKRLASDKNTYLYKESLLTDQKSIIIQKSLDIFDKINLIDITMTGGSFALPLIIELLLSEQMGKYVVCSPIASMNEFSMQRMQLFSLEARLPKFPCGSILADIEYQDCRSQIDDLNRQWPENSRVCNVFLLLDSILGRFLSPENILHNIWSSMNEDDLLVVSQGIYHDGCEEKLVDNYRELVKKFSMTRQLADLINEEAPILVNWDERISGARFTVQADRNVNLMGSEIQKGEEVTILRNCRLPEERLKMLIKSSLFRISDISYSEDESCAVMFLKKRI